jgi:hypothetical protein
MRRLAAGRKPEFLPPLETRLERDAKGRQQTVVVADEPFRAILGSVRQRFWNRVEDLYGDDCGILEVGDIADSTRLRGNPN